jgi:hypothetical protein
MWRLCKELNGLTGRYGTVRSKRRGTKRAVRIMEFSKDEEKFWIGSLDRHCGSQNVGGPARI